MNANTFEEILRQLYREQPTEPLYHYTSISGLLGIVPSGVLRATDVRYFSDSSELKRTVKLLQTAVASAPASDAKISQLRESFLAWLPDRLSELGSLVFAASFTQQGNLLSQWRGYCEPGKGISLGFSSESLLASAASQGWKFGRCVYHPKRQQVVAAAILRAVENLWIEEGRERVGLNRADILFGSIENDLLHVAALMKYPAFSEEEEWRAISPIVTSYVTAPIEYRDGPSTLTPYLNFKLPSAPDRIVSLDHAWIGPTPHPTNAILAVNNYLAKHRSSPRLGVGYCSIPYRTW